MRLPVRRRDVVEVHAAADVLVALVPEVPVLRVAARRVVVVEDRHEDAAHAVDPDRRLARQIHELQDFPLRAEVEQADRVVRIRDRVHLRQVRRGWIVHRGRLDVELQRQARHTRVPASRRECVRAGRAGDGAIVRTQRPRPAGRDVTLEQVGLAGDVNAEARAIRGEVAGHVDRQDYRLRHELDRAVARRVADVRRATLAQMRIVPEVAVREDPVPVTIRQEPVGGAHVAVELDGHLVGQVDHAVHAGRAPVDAHVRGAVHGPRGLVVATHVVAGQALVARHAHVRHGVEDRRDSGQAARGALTQRRIGR